MEDYLITIRIENDNSTHTFSEGTSLKSILQASTLKDKDLYLAAYVNNCPKGLQHRIYTSKSIRFIQFDSIEGRRIYSRTAQIIMEKAIFELTGEVALRALHSVGEGIFFEMDDPSLNCEEFANKVKERMTELVESNIPIVRKKIESEKLIEKYKELNFTNKVTLLETRPSFFFTVYDLDGYKSYYYGSMAPSTGYIKVFDIRHCNQGILLLLPKKEDINTLEEYVDRPKLYKVFREYKQWTKCLNVACVGDLNKYILEDYSKYIVMVGESLHEKRFSRIADKIYERNQTQKTKIVLVSGPSSSGKTTFSMRLSIHLEVMGLKPIPISMDDYFVGREQTPKDENGNYDFECLEAVDTKLFNENIMALLKGETIDVPKFDFITGKRVYNGEKLTLDDDSILVIEGIHALNPKILDNIDQKQIFRIYASALTALSIDSANIIHTTDNRLLRRIVRDFNFRGRSAYDTLKGWQSVREGEEKNIFPYQELCDEMVNTSLIYELAVLAPIAEPLLRAVPHNTPQYADALRLLKFLTYFIEIDQKYIPQTSIIREFIGGSNFDY